MNKHIPDLCYMPERSVMVTAQGFKTMAKEYTITSGAKMMKMTTEQKELLKRAAQLVRKAQEEVTDMNDPLYGQLDECFYILLDLTEEQ